MKLPFSFGARLAFRILFPGSVLALFLWPLATAGKARLAITLDDLALFSILAVATGWLCSLADQHIYMLLMGRRYWPAWLRRLGLYWQQERLHRLHWRIGLTDAERRTMSEAERHAAEARQREAELDRLEFPLGSDGAAEDPPPRVVVAPTRLGNLLAGYESYPLWKYGLDGPFYWPWLFVGLPKDLRDELDERQAAVDGAVYVAFALGCGAVLLAAYAVHDLVSDHAPLAGLAPTAKLVLALAALAAGYLVYRTSLQAHAQFGALFCAVFDRFHRDIDVGPALRCAAEIRREPDLSWGSERYRNAARFLKWHIYRPAGSGANVPLPNHRGTRRTSQGD